jgi:hypothetical protein
VDQRREYPVVALSQRSRLEAELLTFLDEPSPQAAPVAPRRFALALAADPETSAAMVDDALATVSRQQGHSARQIASVRLTLVLESVDAPREQKTLPIEVRRDADGNTFTAATPDLGAWGHGATVGEAFLDFLADLTERSAILMAHRDVLGPTLDRQAEALERWGGRAD